MSGAAALSRLSEAKLRAWLLARMRGDREDPPVSDLHDESPDDYVTVVYQQSRDKRFHARLEKAIVAALGEAAAGDLRHGPDARAVRYLADVADSLALRAAAPLLEEIAERGSFGGHDGALDPEAEELVLFALAGLQTPAALWPKWQAVWERKVPQLWPVVTTGMRFSDPRRALAILPEAIARAEQVAGFPLGEVLWALATDPDLKAGDFEKALEGLAHGALQRCRDALRAVGAEDEEVDAWVPAPTSGVWWTMPGHKIPRQPPRAA